MGSFSWSVPTSSSSSSPGSNSASASSGRMFGLYDQEIDWTTGDYVDTDDGAWSEVPDSRTAVMLQLELHYGKCWWAPNAGSRIEELLTRETPPTAAELALEVRRALGVLAAEGIISELIVEIASEEYGAVELHLTYVDRASGQTVDGFYMPFGGQS